MEELVLALDRTAIVNIPDNIIEKIYEDIRTSFKLKTNNFIVQAIRDGGLGKYGISLRFSVQTVGYWINRKAKEEFDAKRGML